MAERAAFAVRFWGVRGTVPCPGAATLRYGGNTSCIELCCGRERLIFDAGTGLRVLGNELARGNGVISGHIFLTHTHMDHVQGLPFFRPAYLEQNRFEFWNGHLRRQQRHLQEVLYTLMQRPFFPVPLDIMHAFIAFHDFDAGDTLTPVEGVRMRTAALNHPGGATGYRVEFDGRAVCVVTDTEHVESTLDQAILGLVAGSELMIYDATYTEAEFPRYRGWGHSTWQEGVRLCREAGVKRLIAFHHDPDHDDDALDRIGAELAEAMPGSLIAREGMRLEI
jgi:phosphoribosyl 1,2-cyclic phosphodiesterase